MRVFSGGKTLSKDFGKPGTLAATGMNFEALREREKKSLTDWVINSGYFCIFDFVSNEIR